MRLLGQSWFIIIQHDFSSYGEVVFYINTAAFLLLFLVLFNE